MASEPELQEAMISQDGHWTAIRDLFDELIDLPPRERASRLARSTRPESVLREVSELLNAAGLAGDFLEGPIGVTLTASGPASVPSYSSLPSGAEVGPFRIVSLIGRGGQGEVYRAERADGAFDQTVALKLLRPEAIEHFERFRTERQILAGLEHPAIARLIDGGTAPDGRPYLAMEFVEGEDVATYCDTHGLDLRSRLALFGDICAAVVYAHRNLVVHRDLKPDNVLVTRGGSVKLLDFGIARILAETDRTALTAAILTPDYAAPEQFEGRRATTATDVYALGAILFELMTGRPPWLSRGGPFPGAARLFQDEPPRASRSVERRARPPVAPREIEGDLDAIAAMAMRHEPEDRYPDVSALWDDIERHLALRPVKARGGDAAYRLRRFVRRNRGRLAAGTLTAATIAIGAASFAWQARRTGIQRAVAREESAKASAVRDYIMLMLRTAGQEAGPTFGTAKQILDGTAAHLSREAEGADGSHAALLRVLGELYIEMDDPAAAAPLLETCALLARQNCDEAGLAQARQSLAVVAIRRGQLDAAERDLRAAQRFWDTDRSRFARQRAEAAGIEAAWLRERGSPVAAVALLQAAIAQTADLLGPESHEIATLQHNFGVHLLESGRLSEADAALATAWTALVAQGRTRSAIGIGVMNHRGGLAFRTGRIDEAEAMWRDAIELRRALYGPSSALAALQLNLARLLIMREKPADALPILDEAIAMAMAFAGEDSSATLILRQSRALALGLMERLDEAWVEIETALAGSRRAFGGSHTYHAIGLSARAQLHMMAGDVPSAWRDIDAASAILTEGGPAAAQHLRDLDQLRSILEPFAPPEGFSAQSLPDNSR